jgi:hypothetical protein
LEVFRRNGVCDKHKKQTQNNNSNIKAENNTHKIMTIEKIIDKQMLAYDTRDIDSMMSVFSDDIKIINFSDGKIVVDGFEDCKKMFSDLFKNSPKLRAEILKTISFDNKVIVQEYIYGRNGSDEKMEQVIIFEVTNEKINKISMIRKDI